MDDRPKVGDRSVRNLLDLDGDAYFISDQGHWVKFEVSQVEPSPERPHGIRYSMTLHDEQNRRLLGFDNAHAPESKGPSGGRDKRYDHRHFGHSVRRYDFRTAEQLLVDFWAAVDRFLREKGVRP